jgi:hypothetical protein
VQRSFVGAHGVSDQEQPVTGEDRRLAIEASDTDDVVADAREHGRFG